MRRFKSLLAISIFFSALSIPVSVAEDYATAADARTAANKAMTDFQKASADCKDITNPKYKLTEAESAGIKLIMEHAKTLLEDCTVPEIFSEQSVKALTSDNAATPAKEISDYSDYVMEFESYSSSIEAVADDINESLPMLKELGVLILNRQNEIRNAESGISKFETIYSGYSNEIKTNINANEVWGKYQNLKILIGNEKDTYSKVLEILDGWNRLVDIDLISAQINKLLSNKIPLAELEKAISDMKLLAVPKSAKPTTPIVINKAITITCVKGKVLKKITAISPKCPAGFKKR